MGTYDDPPADPYCFGSLRKGLEVIQCFTQREPWSLTELAAELGQSKTTVLRILQTLEAFGHVKKDPVTARYTLSLRPVTLRVAPVWQEQLRWHALPPLQDLALQTGETVQVGILNDHTATCVQAVEGTRLVRMHAFIGKRVPAHASALGKVLLAHLPDAELEAFLTRPMPRFTVRTMSDPTTLRMALQRIRANGFALDEEEVETGLRCLGMPITDHAGRSCAGLAISGPSARMTAERMTALIPQVRATASRISRMLGSPAMLDSASAA
jgi:DNA-binding IclR family transcriptional regulator